MELPGTLGKYRLTRLIGEGATGTVYHAVDTFSGHEVAYKLVDKAVLEDPRFDEQCRRQFLNEAALAGRLKHPHIVDILEAAVTQDTGYVVMEYVAGGNLVAYTRPERLLAVEDSLELLFKCCGALDYAFRQGIIHRDIKPANIMVAGGTEAKLADFGASIFYRAEATHVVSVGTPYYMSPEQFRGEALSHLSDMYSLGVLGYELLTGHRPFEAQSLEHLYLAITETHAQPPGAHRHDLPKGLDDLILRMLAKRPQDRYQNWADLALEIAQLGRFSAFSQAISDSEKFNALRKLPEFSDFSDPELWTLLRACVWTRLPARTTVIHEGDSVDAMYLLLAGDVKVTREGRLLNILKPGEWFGEMAYIQRRATRQTSVASLSDALIARLPCSALVALSQGVELKLSRMMLRTLADRLSLADSRILQARQ